MSLRRLHHEQPDSFSFTPANADWAKKQIEKYPDGRQASAVIPLLWRAQEQEGWVSRPIIEEIARMLDLAEIRVLEVATFYFMFQLQPVGSLAHIQICGTTSCMICGAEDLVAVCKEKIASAPHQISACGKFSWEEVECLGACSNAPMAQIGKDYYEDLTTESLGAIIDGFARGDVPTPGPQNGRFASEPLNGLTSLNGDAAHGLNASLDIAAQQSDTIKRIDGSEPIARWSADDPPKHKSSKAEANAPKASENLVAARASETSSDEPPADDAKPELLARARDGGADDLKKIKGIGPKLEKLCNSLGVWHFDQIASWNAEEVAWVDFHLEGFKGRVLRDGWVEQAKVLAADGETEFSKSSG